MFEFWKNIFIQRQAKDIVRSTLEEYQRMLIATENQAAYQLKLAEYYRESIVRLGKFKPLV